MANFVYGGGPQGWGPAGVGARRGGGPQGWGPGGVVMADFGQSDFGQPTLAKPTLASVSVLVVWPTLAKTDCGQNRLWTKPTVAKPTLAKPT